MRSSPCRPAAALPLLIIATAAGCGSDSGSSGGGGGEAVNGTGYSVEAPDEWKDRTADASQNTSIKPDRLLAGPTVDGAVTNVNVVFEPKPKATIDQIGEGFRAQIPAIGASDISKASKRELAGEQAVTYTYTLKGQGPLRRSRQVAAAHGGRLYTVSMTASAKDFPDAEKRLQEILASWKWR